jgi:hypothetical protein
MDIKKLDVKPLKWETDYLILGKSNSVTVGDKGIVNFHGNTYDVTVVSVHKSNVVLETKSDKLRKNKIYNNVSILYRKIINKM